jgi:hypothetical protein
LEGIKIQGCGLGVQRKTGIGDGQSEAIDTPGVPFKLILIS